MSDHVVVATAGHVDHGKSTLIRALTGMEPDRWAEERRRGLTIDLGFAWTTLPSGRVVAFVDVPGHQRFLGNTLAGVGPSPVVVFVVAADEGWSAQSGDHRDAIAALGISRGVVVITKTDRGAATAVQARIREELADTGLRDAPVVPVSATTGTGLDELRATLDAVLATVPEPAPTARVRLWVDRSFTITGAGNVVTGTLTAGTVTRGDHLELRRSGSSRTVVVRGLESLGEPRATLGPVNRVALNLRGISAAEVRRGDTLVTPGAWLSTAELDVRRVSGTALGELPERITVHVGTAAIATRIRPFDDDHARLALHGSLPLVLGDRLVLRHPGSRKVLGGVVVLDADPPALLRRGDGARRTATLTTMDSGGDVVAEVARRGVVTVEQLRRLGLRAPAPPDGVRVIDEWWVHGPAFDAWRQRLRSAVEQLHARNPLSAGLSRGAARDLLGLPADSLLTAVIVATGLTNHDGYLRVPGTEGDLGSAEGAITELEKRLAATPFGAPEADDLATLGLGIRELAAAERSGRVLRLSGGVVLLPTAPALAMRELARLDQPFTTSAARQALGTSRRVAIPLLEHLDARGWTRRLDAGHREVVARGK